MEEIYNCPFLDRNKTDCSNCQQIFILLTSASLSPQNFAPLPTWDLVHSSLIPGVIVIRNHTTLSFNFLCFQCL
jgi:hypothetical protein